MQALSFPSRSRRMAAAVLAAVVLLQSGCATLPPPTTAHQGDPGRVAVVAASEAPKLEFQGFARGKGEGAIRGAGASFGECLGAMSHGGCSGELCGAVLVLMLGICGAIGVVGGVVGAAEAPSAQAARADEGAAQAAFATAEIQEALRAHVAAAALAAGERLVEPPPSPGDGAARSGYAAFAAAGVDSVLEVALVEAGTRGRGINDPVAAYMTARVRLVSAADGRERFVRNYTYLGPRHALAEWAADDARRLRQTLEAGYRSLAEHIYDSVFRLYPFPEWSPHGAGVLAAAFGLAPLSPRTRGALPADDLIGSRFNWTEVDSLQPVLRWEAFPRAGDLKVAPDEMARVAGVRYDLVIARSENAAPGEIVYRRDGLAATDHRLETALEPGARYFWSVRARFVLDGRERVTEWSSVHYAAREGLTAPSPFSYRFRTP